MFDFASININLGVDMSHVRRFVVDADNVNTVKEMCQNSRILINCVGPVRKFDLLIKVTF